jgi:predicted nucleic acid-binding protein
MKVVIDTNIIVQDFWLDSPNSRVFLEGLILIPAVLYVPEIVIDETVNIYKERLLEKNNTIRQIRKDVTDLLRFEIKDISFNEKNITERYRKSLLDKIHGINSEIISYPKTEHKVIVKKILERRKPFKKGDAGYRDFLIWEGIRNLELWGTEEIVFITNNVKDFGQGPYLPEEFSDKKTNNKNIKICVSISKFNEEYIFPRLNNLTDLRNRLIEGQVENFNFKKWIDENLLDILKECDLEEVIVGFPYGVGRVRADEIIIFNDYGIDQLKELESGDKFLSFKIELKLQASMRVSWEDFVENEEVREYLGHNSEEFSIIESETAENIEVCGYLMLSCDNLSVMSYEITAIDGPYGSIDME